MSLKKYILSIYINLTLYDPSGWIQNNSNMGILEIIILMLASMPCHAALAHNLSDEQLPADGSKSAAVVVHLNGRRLFRLAGYYCVDTGEP